MRLLRFDESDRLILTDFRGKPTPPYAILSHRWGNSEALFEDISNRNYEEKVEGHRKLRFCAEQAAQDGLRYFWIDTCCINKWDKDELSKAINSMFKWYQNAARCYVFLSDVSLSAVTETAAYSDWEASFRESKWFTRGWTLQELIAPVIVEFFSVEGRRIGDKVALGPLLHDITGIPLEALRSLPLEQFSTSERMRWFGDRTTTEEEDAVYCLLGLLGVSISATYGEGKESAQRRLQTELEAANNAPSIIPFSRNESFVGCETQLAELEAKLFSNDQTTTTLAIVGPGGTGKSQLALEVAHRARLNNKDCSVFWIDAGDLDSLYRSYASVARKLCFPGCDDDQADMKQVTKCCVAELNTRHCLLVLDNVESTTLRASGSSTARAAELADFLPHSNLCSVIFTTTEGDVAETLAPQNVTALHELTPDTALRMLQNRLTTPLSDAEQQDAMHLLRELSCLPLAVVQAAACINASSMSVRQYQAQLSQHKEAALKYSDGSSEGEHQESDLRKTVAATLSFSMSQVRLSNAVAADYLFIAACVDRKDISLDLLEAASPQAREHAVKVLDKYALVSRRPAECALDVHRLVHQALRNQLQVQGQLMQWTQRTIAQLLRVFPNNNYSNRSKWRRLLPHVQNALAYNIVDDDNEERLDLASKCAKTLCSDGRYKEAEGLQVQVVQTTMRLLGNEDPDALTSMHNLASTYRNQGRWKEAERLQLQAMQAMKRVLGKEHPYTLCSMANLASTYRNQGRWKEAEELDIEVMETSKAKLGAEHPDTVTSMANLASTYWDQGRWKEAEELEVEVMQIRKKALGDEHPDMLISMANLASTYRNQGRWKEAEALQVQVMQTTTRVLGDEHPHTLASIANLASTYRNQGRWKEAEKLEMEVMQTTMRLLGNEHPNTLSSMANLALTYWNQGRWKEAEELQLQAMQTMKRVLGKEHPDTLSSINNLASTYRNQGRWKEAEELQLQAMQTMKRVLGKEHPYTLCSMANLASTYSDQERWREAEELQVQVMQTTKRVLGNEHPNTLTSIANLASTYWDQGRWDKAEELQTQVMEARKRVLGDEHPDTLTSIANLAFTLRSQARHEEAVVLMELCFQLRQQVLGEQHYDTQSSPDTLKRWRGVVEQ